MASLFSQSVSVASNFYSTAMSSLNTIPTLLPAAPSSPIDFSLYTSQIFKSRLPFSFGLVQSISSLNLPPITIPLPLQNLTFWQVANIAFFVFTVGILSWMLDSHHSDDDNEELLSNPKSSTTTTPPQIVIPNTVEILTPPPPRARRQTLETIATFVNFEDIQRSSRRRRSLRSPLPCSLFNSPIDNTSSSSTSTLLLNSTTATSPPTSPTSTDAHGQLISTPLGKGKSLLRKASENSSCRNRNRRRYSFQDEVVRRGLEVVADYDRVGIVSTEEADQRRSGSWRTGLLLGLRIPVGWTMK
ncbi:hypothetical protein TWF506_002949 [Arthrobotrys conoides]|uniref:Uncharacterized protein n=1 Tax=Arthrobotrys conoides TaxID=74498 RepID=A0AAN8NMH5_9PEZI